MFNFNKIFMEIKTDFRMLHLAEIDTNEGQVAGVKANPRTISEKDYKKLLKSLRASNLTDIAAAENIDFYCVQDDDTQYIECFSADGHSRAAAAAAAVRYAFAAIEDMMRKKHIGVFGLPQSGDFIGGYADKKNRLYAHKVMNTTFYLRPYIYRGERGQQDDDTSMFAGIHNAGLFTGTAMCGLSLHQCPSAVQGGGLTDIYNECKLLQKALTVPLQFPSAVHAEKQIKNGGRLHHRINYRYLAPRVLKVGECERSNIAWDTYSEDCPFTNEPKRRVNYE